MTKQQHPITLPPELVAQWVEYAGLVGINEHQLIHLATQAARWGADQELEACCEHLKRIWSLSGTIDSLRAARRPKPLSLKDQALNELDLTADSNGAELSRTQVELIRRALEQPAAAPVPVSERLPGPSDCAP